MFWEGSGIRHKTPWFLSFPAPGGHHLDDPGEPRLVHDALLYSIYFI